MAQDNIPHTLRIDFGSQVPQALLSDIAQYVMDRASVDGLFAYQRFDRATSQQVVEIVAHDRSKVVMIDADQSFIARLVQLAFDAREAGMTPGEYLASRLNDIPSDEDLVE